MLPKRSYLWACLSIVVVAGCASTPPPCQSMQVAHCELQPVAGLGQVRLRVRDAKTNQPWPGVVVQVQRTTLGAITRVDGVASILNVPDGVYDLLVRWCGIEDCHLTGVVVRAGFLTDAGTVFPCKSHIELDPIITW